MHGEPAPRRLRIVLAVSLCLTIGGLAHAAELTQDVTLSSTEVEVVDLIGAIQVVPASGSVFEATITIRGKDARPDLLEVVTDDGEKGRILIKFPVAKHADYVYPPLGAGHRVTVSPQDAKRGSWLDQLLRGLGKDRVTVRGQGKGLEVWADITLRVPAERSAKVVVSAGSIDAQGVIGDLVLDTGGGPITVHDHDGVLDCDTGSGDVMVANHRGDSLKIDTGSGSVRIETADTPHLDVDTGSGDVSAMAIGTDRARIDTGSGSVTLQLVRMGDGKFTIDTGSGSVDLEVPPAASADVSVDVGSGDIHCDLPGAEILHKEEDELRVKLRDGAARVVIDTGSGDATITQG